MKKIIQWILSLFKKKPDVINIKESELTYSEIDDNGNLKDNKHIKVQFIQDTKKDTGE